MIDGIFHPSSLGFPFSPLVKNTAVGLYVHKSLFVVLEWIPKVTAFKSFQRS
jgi:hypothetical protein